LSALVAAYGRRVSYGMVYRNIGAPTQTQHERKSISSGDIFPKIIWEAQSGQILRSGTSESGILLKYDVFLGSSRRTKSTAFSSLLKGGAPIDH